MIIPVDFSAITENRKIEEVNEIIYVDFHLKQVTKTITCDDDCVFINFMDEDDFDIPSFC